MRILFLNHNVLWRSTFIRCYLFGRELVRMGHSVTLVTNAPRERLRFQESEIEGIRVIETPDLFWGRLRTGWDPLNAVRRAMYLNDESFDIIHEFDSRPTVILPSLWKRSHRGIRITDWADWWGRGGAIRVRRDVLLNRLFEPVETFFEERFRTRADALIAICRPLKDRAIALGVPEERIDVIPNGSPVDTISVLPKESCRRQLGWDPAREYVAFSGFVLYDFEMALRAFAMAYARRPRLCLILTGARSELAERLVPSEALIQTGLLPRAEYAAALGAADLHLLPLTDTVANRGRLPGKLGDYLASGRPVVTSPVGDVERIVRESRGGVLVPPTAEAMAEAILSLAGDPARLEDLGRNARRYAEQSFSTRLMTERLVRRYEQELERKRTLAMAGGF